MFYLSARFSPIVGCLLTMPFMVGYLMYLNGFYSSMLSPGQRSPACSGINTYPVSHLARARGMHVSHFTTFRVIFTLASIKQSLFFRTLKSENSVIK